MFIFPIHCVFEDLRTKKVIGRGHEDQGLHILDSPPHITTEVQQLLSSDNVFNAA